MKFFPGKNRGRPMKAICLSLLIVLSIPVFAQKNNTATENSSDKFYWGVSIAPSLIEKGHIHGDKNKYQISSTPQFGGEVLINYYYNFESNYVLVFSAGAELLVHDFNYEIPKEMFDSVGGTNISFNPVGPIKMSSSYLKAQAEVQSKFHKKHKKSWVGVVGLSILYPIQGGDEYSAGILWGSNSQSAEEYLLIQYDYYEQRPLLNFHISGGHEWILNRGNLLQANVKVNFSPVTFAYATYRFNVGNQPEVSGNYRISGSYIGLCISYVFARSKKG